MDLEIRYENGSMTVHLEEFLNIRSIAKVRKLLKLIRSSFTPECEQQMKEFVQDWIEQFEQKQLENERYITGYEQKVGYCQKQLRDALYTRDSYKKSTPLHKSEGWDKWNEGVKGCRKELAEVKTLLRFYQSRYNSNIRNKDFYKKVLENIT
jgi:hypothetical protein